jgi:hypothetical protein
MVMVTHDNYLASFGDKVIHIRDGKIIKVEEHPGGAGESLDGLMPDSLPGGTLAVPAEMQQMPNVQQVTDPQTQYAQQPAEQQVQYMQQPAEQQMQYTQQPVTDMQTQYGAQQTQTAPQMVPSEEMTVNENV